MHCNALSNLFSISCFEGILVFLTGKREISYMCRKVSKALNGKKRSALSLSAEKETTGDNTVSITAENGVSKKRNREVMDLGSAAESITDHVDSSTPSNGYTSSTPSNGYTSSTPFNGYTSSTGALRGLDDDEIDGEDGEGGAVDGQDDDLFSDGAEDSDGEDYESEEDNDGYDSLGEEGIFEEEKAKRTAASASALLPSLKGSDGDEDGGDKDEDAARLRNKMLKEVLGLPEEYVISTCSVSIFHILSL